MPEPSAKSAAERRLESVHSDDDAPATPEDVHDAQVALERDLSTLIASHPRIGMSDSEVLEAALHDRFGQHPHVGDIRGRGMFRGLELVADRDDKTPFDPARAINKRLKAAAFEAGLICYPAGDTIDGRSGDHVLLAPPYIIDAADIDRIVERLTE